MSEQKRPVGRHQDRSQRAAGDAERTLRNRDDLACRHHDPELFFPVSDRPGAASAPHTDAAKRVCRGCPARALCLQVALERGDTWAVLGGTTPRERRHLRARQHAA